MSETTTTTGPSSPSLQATSPGEFRRGLKPLVAAMAVYGGSPIILLQTGGLFVSPVMKDTGLPASAVTVAPIVTLVLALSQPMVGILINRWGTRPLAIAALASMISGLVILAVAPASFLTFYAVGILVGLGGALGFTTTITKFLSVWFRKNFGTAVGIVGGSASLIPLIAIPLITFAIYNAGWRFGYLVLVGFVALICLPVMLWGFREPKTPLFDASESPHAAASGEADDVPGYSLRDALKTAHYWVLLASFLIVSFALGGFIAHLQPLLLLQGFPVAEATAMSMSILIGVLAGRVVGGFLLDRLWPYLVPAIVLSLSGAAALVMGMVSSNTSIGLVTGLVFAIGLSQGAEGDFPAFFMLREFGARQYALIGGIAYLLTGVGTSIGGITFAAIRDTTGDYALGAHLGSAAYLLGAVLSLMAGVLSLRARRSTGSVELN